METLENTTGGVCAVSPADFTPEHIAVAFLMKRFTEMPKESFRDVISLVEQWMNPDTPIDYHGEIFETIREILFPELIGGVCIETAGATAEMPENIQKRAEHVGKTIKKLRKEHSLKQTELAKKSGLPQSHISRLEAGAHSPSFKTLEKIAKALGVTVGDLDPSH